MPSLTPTVFVVDSDASLRASLGESIRRAGWTAETFASAEEFLAWPRLLIPSCLLLEITAPDLESFELLRRIASVRRETPVIVISGQADIPMTVRAMQAGAIELLMKPLGEDMVLAAVGHAVTRSQVLLPQESELVGLRKRYESLSGREREVMARVVSGLLNKQVAAALGISEITVKAHRGRVMRKMGASSLAELVSMTMRLPVSSGRPTNAGTHRIPAEPRVDRPASGHLSIAV